MTWQLLQTEKSYKIQEKGVFTLVQSKKDLNINKIELTKKLVKMGIKVTKITSTNVQQKSKKKGRHKITSTNVQQKSKKKGRHTILQFRPKKYFVILESGSTITEDNINSLNNSEVSTNII